MTKQDLYQMYKAETGKNPDAQCYFSDLCSNCGEEVDIDVNLSEFEYFTWMETKFLELLEQQNLKGIHQ
jgi:hypothetical protein